MVTQSAGCVHGLRQLGYGSPGRHLAPAPWSAAHSASDLQPVYLQPPSTQLQLSRSTLTSVSTHSITSVQPSVHVLTLTDDKYRSRHTPLKKAHSASSRQPSQ